MRIARVIGTVTLNQTEPNLRAGSLLVAEALDARSLAGLERATPRGTPMPESLVVFDELGAGLGQIIAVSEGREASVPFWPQPVPIDAYCAAILDHVVWKQVPAARAAEGKSSKAAEQEHRK